MISPFEMETPFKRILPVKISVPSHHRDASNLSLGLNVVGIAFRSKKKLNTVLFLFDPGNENDLENAEFFFVMSCNSANDNDKTIGSF